MSQEIEIEFKNLLTKAEYENLKNAFQFNLDDAVIQTNYYFETDDFHLKQKGSALRIRKKSDQYKFTLKEPYEKGLLETHGPISEEKFLLSIKGEIDIPNQITERLHNLNVPTKELKYVGELTTIRLEKNYMNCLLVLDHSQYHGMEDFELELEANTYEDGERVFKNLLNLYNIEKRSTKNKIERFFEQL